MPAAIGDGYNSRPDHQPGCQLGPHVMPAGGGNTGRPIRIEGRFLPQRLGGLGVDELVGVRMEDPEVFDTAHQLVSTLIADGRVTGLRIDHPDGLHDPGAYLLHLQLTRLRDLQLAGFIALDGLGKTGEQIIAAVVACDQAEPFGLG